MHLRYIIECMLKEYIHDSTNLKLFVNKIISSSESDKVTFQDFKEKDEASRLLRLTHEVVGALVDTNSIFRAWDLLHNHQLGLRSQYFEAYNKLKEEQDEFLNNPIDVVEGALRCFKCHSNRTITFTRQTRSSDEGTTVFVQCIACKNSWTES